MTHLNKDYTPSPRVMTAHQPPKVVYITDFAPDTPPATNIFLAWQLAQQTTTAPVILANNLAPNYIDPNSAAAQAMPPLSSVLKPPVQPVVDPASWARIVGTNPIIYPISLY
jgi:hypothetical protein